MSKTKCSLKNSFPTEILNNLHLGSADGHRDTLVEEGFVVTKSINTFCSDNHSIIVGPFGSGKSALFKLLKNRSEKLKNFQNDLIVPIEEQIQFAEIRLLAETIFTTLDERMTYQLLWKFQICRRISEEISKFDNFPKNDSENYISEFLVRSGGQNGHLSIVARLKELISTVSFKIKAKISKTPLDVELGKEAQKSAKRVEVNLDTVIAKASEIITQNNFKRATVIIDKIDKFVSGEEYETQKEYIEALLEVEDDFYPNPNIFFKIFLRSDLYERLNFTSIGPDKAADNTLNLKWGPGEIRRFIAIRLFLALAKAGVWTFNDITESTDLSEFSLKWYDKVLLDSRKEGFKYNIAKRCKTIFGRKRKTVSLYEKLDKAVISKLFEHNLLHENDKGKEEIINCHSFFDSHFLDGNEICTPRYILIFLKKLIEESNEYYNSNPQMKVIPSQYNGDWVWNLFTADLVYGAYIKSKNEYLNYVAKVDAKWTGYVKELLENKNKRELFDYKAISACVDFNGDNQKAYAFCVFLQVIGFLKIIKYHRDIKKRKYSLPIIYSEGKS